MLDNGTGMPPELIAAPFEAARRPNPGPSPGGAPRNGAASRTRKSAGAGLGLSIAKGIVQAHGGRIELTPLPQGTCFSVYLPVEAEVLVTSRTAADARRATEGTGDGDDD